MATRKDYLVRTHALTVSIQLPNIVNGMSLMLKIELDLPEYESYELLRKQVYTAMTAGSEYFGFA